jgi:hypothetical protein
VKNTKAPHLAVHGVVEVELAFARWRVHHAVLWISVIH